MESSQELNQTQPESWGWKNVGSGRFFQHIQTDPADWWAFKWTWGTFIFELHWVGSAIQFVGCARLRTQFTRLRTELTVEAAEGLYCTGKMLDPGHSIGSGRLPGSLRTVWSGKMSDPGWTQPTHVGIQTDPGPLFSSFTGSVLHDSSIQFTVVLGYRKCSLRNELRMN